jgi:sterol desaturase/sphingolipid hydroxylase (fatty acid hydroxylase superfamily)
VLWRFHKVHHSITELDWLAAARLHPVDQAFGRACIVVPLFALGFTRGTFGALLVVFTLQAIFIHANVRFTFGRLRYVFATPEFHHWHHSADPRAYNSNFAGELPVLDKVFGTLHLPARDGSEGARWPDAYGIAEPAPAGYFRQLSWPFHGAPHTGPTATRES